GRPESDGLARFFDVVLDIHRQLFLGTTGRLIVELVVGWSVVLIVTGVCLWWPKRLSQWAGVWWPRWRAKPYVVLRDLHTITALYLLIPIVIIVVTGLFYTLVWGEAFYLATRDPRRSPPGGVSPQIPSKATHPKELKAPALALDRIEALARARHRKWSLWIELPKPNAPEVQVRAGNDFNNSYGPYLSAQFAIDRTDGRIVSHKTLAEDDRYWWHGWVYPLHVGSIYGPTTKVLWLISCLILSALPVTGLWMWLLRRPTGRTGFPRRPDRRLPSALVATIGVFGVLLPVMGASMVLILAGEGLAGLVRSRRSRESLA
ncbi:PepSY-associated TM helix domain-containing protein, partial [Singulisphaera rosea]